MTNKKTYFFGQHEDEEVVLLLRRHWSVLSGAITKVTIFIFILAALFAAILFFTPFLAEQPYLGLVLFISSLCLMAVWSWLSLKIIDYYLDVWIITNERIVNIVQTGLFKRTSSTLNLSNILDITADVSGLSATLFHYGNLYIQTAAEKEKFFIERVSHPEKIKAVIMDLYRNALINERNEVFSPPPAENKIPAEPENEKK